MTVVGHLRRFGRRPTTSDPPPTPDVVPQRSKRRYGPEADMGRFINPSHLTTQERSGLGPLFDNSVRSDDQVAGDLDSQLCCCLRID